MKHRTSVSPWPMVLALALGACATPRSQPAPAALPLPVPAIAEPPPVVLAPGPPIAAAPNMSLRTALSVGGCRVAARMTLLPTASGKPVVTLKVNGRLVRMTVDTGAETSLLTREGAAWLGLAPGPSRRVVQGMGGAGRYGVVRLDSILFGGILSHGLELPIVAIGDASSTGNAPELAGIIGADLMHPFEAAFDFADRRLTLYRAHDCRPDPGSAVLPWRGRYDLPLVAATLDGRQLTALIDTGSSYSAVGQSSAIRAEPAGPDDRSITSYSAGDMPMHGTTHRFASLTVGTIDVPAPLLRVIPLDPALGIDLLIGMDILAGHRFWLAYPARTAFLAPEGSN